MANNPRRIVIANEVKHSSLRANVMSEAISIGIARQPKEITSSFHSSQWRCLLRPFLKKGSQWRSHSKARQCRRFASLTAALRIPHANF